MILKLLTRLSIGIIIASIWTGSARSAEAQTSAAAKPSTSETAKTPKPADEKIKRQSTIAAGDSVSIADIQRAADQLAIAVQEAVRKATEDPAVKVAALKVATNAVNAAQVVLEQQSATLQTVLDSLAREIAMATEKQQTKTKNH